LNHIIFYLDVNSAFLSWKAVYRLTHKGGRQNLREITCELLFTEIVAVGFLEIAFVLFKDM